MEEEFFIETLARIYIRDRENMSVHVKSNTNPFGISKKSSYLQQISYLKKLSKLQVMAPRGERVVFCSVSKADWFECIAFISILRQKS